MQQLKQIVQNAGNVEDASEIGCESRDMERMDAKNANIKYMWLRQRHVIQTFILLLPLGGLRFLAALLLDFDGLRLPLFPFFIHLAVGGQWGLVVAMRGVVVMVGMQGRL